MPAGEESNFDHPTAVDTARLHHDIATLQSGKAILGARYDMLTSEPTAPEIMHSAPIIIVEGLVANSKTLREISDLTILAKSSPAARLQRRIERDTKRTGETAAEIVQRFDEQVGPAYLKYYAVNDAQTDFTIERQQFDLKRTKYTQHPAESNAETFTSPRD